VRSRSAKQRARARARAESQQCRGKARVRKAREEIIALAIGYVIVGSSGAGETRTIVASAKRQWSASGKGDDKCH